MDCNKFNVIVQITESRKQHPWFIHSKLIIFTTDYVIIRTFRLYSKTEKTKTMKKVKMLYHAEISFHST